MGALLLAALGCKSRTDEVVAAWKEGGHSGGELKPAGEKLPGGKCSAGTIGGMDATLCEFDDEEQAKKAEEAGWELVGKSVGSSVAVGKVVLVISDTRKEDPSGRKLNELIQTFRKELR